MQSLRPHHPRNRWSHCNTPAALRRRRALLDARREELAATLPPIPDDPEPGSVWCVVQVVGAAGVLHSRALYVPRRARCDQHADADGRLVNATRLAEWLRSSIPKRPSYAERAEARGG
jgi:hypothetical protein